MTFDDTGKYPQKAKASVCEQPDYAAVRTEVPNNNIMWDIDSGPTHQQERISDG
jgi:hypothetical protein